MYMVMMMVMQVDGAVVNSGDVGVLGRQVEIIVEGSMEQGFVIATAVPIEATTVPIVGTPGVSDSDDDVGGGIVVTVPTSTPEGLVGGQGGSASMGSGIFEPDMSVEPSATPEVTGIVTVSPSGASSGMFGAVGVGGVSITPEVELSPEESEGASVKGNSEDGGGGISTGSKIAGIAAGAVGILAVLGAVGFALFRGRSSSGGAETAVAATGMRSVSSPPPPPDAGTSTAVAGRSSLTEQTALAEGRHVEISSRGGGGDIGGDTGLGEIGSPAELAPETRTTTANPGIGAGTAAAIGAGAAGVVGAGAIAAKSLSPGKDKSHLSEPSSMEGPAEPPSIEEPPTTRHVPVGKYDTDVSEIQPQTVSREAEAKIMGTPDYGNFDVPENALRDVERTQAIAGETLDTGQVQNVTTMIGRESRSTPNTGGFAPPLAPYHIRHSPVD